MGKVKNSTATKNKVPFRSSKRRRGKSTKLSFVKKAKTRKAKTEIVEEVEEEYQSVIRKNVGYKKRALTRGQKLTVEFVKKYFVIPENFDKDKRFGPLSGSSPELRIVSAYAEGALKLKKGVKNLRMICYVCGTIGHDAMDCDQLC